ncbi:Protein lsb5 [Yarrowia sp. C11]|nr:Protein lsb5 [Yarrowia sp. E02]KAG5373226.1 Protein lsb5 [Yarrowia sp. C11]
MGFLSSDKPYTAVTSTIESLCGRDYEEDDVADMVELMEIIQLRPDGPTEAARAIRKKLKYGGKHAQLRALVILDTLVENGDRLSMLFNDAQLMDRLKIVVSGSEGLHPMDSAVQRKAQAYAKSWSRYKGKRGYEGISSLYKGSSSSAARSRANSSYSNGGAAGGSARRASRYSNRVEDLSEDSDDSRDRDDGYDSPPPRARDSPRARASPRTPRDPSPYSDEDKPKRSSNRGSARYERGFDDEPRSSKPFFSSKTRTRGSTPVDDFDDEDEGERAQFSSRNRRSGGGVADFEDREKTEKTSKRSSLSKFFKGSTPEPGSSSPRGSTPSGLSASSSAAPLNAKIEKPRIQEVLAESHAAATNLNNALRMVNKDKGQLSTQDAYATECFNKCRKLRKKVVRYIHGIHDDEFVGPLLHANEELIAALRHYDKLASTHGSDSEPEDDWRHEDDEVDEVREQVAKISIPKRAPPPIPKKPKDLHYSDDDDDNPFGDDNEL